MRAAEFARADANEPHLDLGPVALGGMFEEMQRTPKEYELLGRFAALPGRAFSREYLLRQLWGYDFDGFDHIVDSHMTRLRKKLGPLGEKIATVWSVGYRFAP